ncbi:MAG: hemin uptake protein HemP [Sulfurifustaceae bacterium]|jgi:hemin uptake protein HemP
MSIRGARMIGEKDDKRGAAKISNTSGRAPARPIPRVPSQALLGNHGQLIIEHAGREYVLRRTSTGKLILTA